MNSPYYAPSGRLPVQAVVLAAAGALLVAVPAWLYAWLTIHSPFVLLDWFAMIAFAVAMGWVAERAARRGKARHPVWMGRLGLAIGIAGWYVHWAAWLAIADAGSFTALLADPQAMWRYAMALADSEVRRIAGMRIESSVLVAGWIVEFILLTMLPRSLARGAAEAPFCELTNTWATSFALPRKFAWIDEPQVVVHRLETAPGQLLSILDACCGKDPVRYCAVTLYRGGGDPFISIDNVEVRRDAKKEKTTTRPVLAYLRLPDMDADRLIEYCAVSTPESMPESTPGSTSESPPAPDDPPELVEAIGHLTAGRFEQALAGATPHVAAARDELRVDAIRLCAFANARLGRWSESLRYWNALFDAEPTAFHASQVGCCYAMTGECTQGQAWIARARALNADSDEMPDPQIVTSYISALTQAGQPARAMPYLEEIRALYTGLGVIDPTLLFVRRIPLFGTFLQNSLPIVRAVLGDAEGRAWYTAMLAHLDQAGQDELASWLDASFVSMTSSTVAPA
ncbi:M48 family metallopeptidase [Massilia sp. HP4]|uniref:tetratricopeptide repeat protein n=1 Tax=Massilia sp. HP4 TaxID=2562316 RepID=UPI0010C08D21|nr:hypothetical protein [Massilia sp. HP4]